MVCAYNAADTLEECLDSLERLTYPGVEIIVVDDGSHDATSAIAKRHPTVRLIQVKHGGLSTARNVGLAHASGEIVAYTDADVMVEPEWLTYLVEPMLASRLAGSGGPNAVPREDPWLAQCVARAPGGPSHVLFDDCIAEHVRCNMAFRRETLLALGGFNPIFTKAGDDVDLCWRLQARGWKIGFAPCAPVWHRHRSSIRAYWRQQLGYGESESWLKPLHPEKFAGRRAIWRGQIYSPLPFVRSLHHAKINLGVWGSAAFPSIYRFDAHPLAHLPHSIRWQLSSLVLLATGGAALRLRFSLRRWSSVSWGGRVRGDGREVPEVCLRHRDRRARSDRVPPRPGEPGRLSRHGGVAPLCPAAGPDIRPRRRLSVSFPRAAAGRTPGERSAVRGPAGTGRAGRCAASDRGHRRGPVLGRALGQRPRATGEDDRLAALVACGRCHRDRRRLAPAPRYQRGGRTVDVA